MNADGFGETGTKDCGTRSELVGDVVVDVETGSISNSSQSCGHTGHGLSGAAEHSTRGKREKTGDGTSVGKL